MSKRIFIGVAWPYVNGQLHVGHMGGYLIPADICARFHRYRGQQVLMVSGSDCHGTPITVEAEQKKISPKKVVALYHRQHKKLFRLYGISFDLYTKTTTANHRRIAQKMFLQLAENGYISRHQTQQYYSPQQKRFLPDRYVEGTCPFCGYTRARGDQCDQCGRILNEGELKNPHSKISGQPVTLRPSEHYYLNLPKLEPFLKKYVSAHGSHWRHWVLQETKGWLKRGLKPRSISRDIDWGIPIPVSKLPPKLRIKGGGKRLYVWFEAVIGYLSASIEWAHNTNKWQDFWYGKNGLEHYYFMGKDNLVFHTLFWPAQLHGSDPKLHLPDYPVINHFLNLQGKQFSKSRGVIVNAKDAAEKYGAEALRFYLTFIAPETSDSSFSWPEFIDVYNNILIGTLANFINRSLHLGQGSYQPQPPNRGVLNKVANHIAKARRHLEICRPRLYLQDILNLAAAGNRYLNQNQPWKIGSGPEFDKAISNTLIFVLGIQLTLAPILPRTTEKLAKMTGVAFNRWPDDSQPLLEKTLPKIKIGSVAPLFKKLT